MAASTDVNLRAFRDFLASLRPPNPVRTAIERFPVDIMTRLRIGLFRVGAKLSMTPPPHEAPTAAELRVRDLTVAKLTRAPVNLTLGNLVDSAVIPRGIKGLEVLHTVLGLSYDDLFPAEVDQRARCSLAVLMATLGAGLNKEGLHAMSKYIRGGHGLGLKPLVLCSSDVCTRMTPVDFALLQINLSKLFLLKAPKLRSVIAPRVGEMLRGSGSPTDWVQKAGITNELLLCPEWGLGATLTEVAHKLRWSHSELTQALG